MKRERGFTLVELMVAVTLTAGAVLAISAMSLTAYHRVNRSGQTTSALGVAEQRTEWLRNQPYDSAALAPGTQTEPLSGFYAGYTLTTRIESDTPVAGIKQVTVMATPPSGKSVQLVSLISGP